MAAAVADYTPLHYSDQKIKKSDSDYSLELARTKDILKALGEIKEKNQTLCGFAMETENVLENARKKLISKKADIIAANTANGENTGFKTDTNILTLITKDNETTLPLMTKEECAHRLLDAILELRR